MRCCCAKPFQRRATARQPAMKICAKMMKSGRGTHGHDSELMPSWQESAPKRAAVTFAPVRAMRAIGIHQHHRRPYAQAARHAHEKQTKHRGSPAQNLRTPDTRAHATRTQAFTSKRAVMSPSTRLLNTALSAHSSEQRTAREARERLPPRNKGKLPRCCYKICSFSRAPSRCRMIDPALSARRNIL